MIENRIVCAANFYDDGTIIVGIRHFCPVMRKTMELINPDISYWKTLDHVQGFLDKYGTFHNREQAYIIAKNANQIIRRVGGDANKLFSENLY